jgi:hypothetical protein
MEQGQLMDATLSHVLISTKTGLPLSRPANATPTNSIAPRQMEDTP